MRRARARVADGQRAPGRGPPPRVWQRQGRGRVREPEGAKPRLQSQARGRVALSPKVARQGGEARTSQWPRLGCSRSAAGTWMTVRNSAELRAQASAV